MSERTATQRGFPDVDPIDAYIDGLMTETERAVFAGRIEQDAALRAEVALQRDIDDTLGELYACPSPERVLARIEEAGVRGTGATRPGFGGVRLGRSLAVAAGVAVAFVGLWRLGFLWRTDLRGDQLGDVAVVGRFDVPYREIDLGGRHPVWVCKDEAEFIGSFVDRFGRGLVLAKMPDGVRALGLSYSDAVTSDTIVLLAEVRGDLVLVFVDRADRDGGFSAAPDSRLHYFRREIGVFALYEVTPLDRPNLLNLFREPESP